jgi:hypothetical protein
MYLTLIVLVVEPVWVYGVEPVWLMVPVVEPVRVDVPVVGPVWVDGGELEGDPVVLPQPERVHGGQARLLVHAVVPCLPKIGM